MTLTPLGEFVYPKAKELLSDAARLQQEARGMAAGNLGWLSIGFTRSTIFSILPAAVREMRRAFPNVRIELVELLSEQQAASLRSGAIHVGLSRTLGKSEPEVDVETVPLFEEELVAAIPLTSVLARRKRLNARDLNDIPYIEYPKNPDSNFSRTAIAALEAAGARIKVGYEAKEIHTALGLVAAGLGMTLVGKTVGKNNRADILFKPVSDLKLAARVYAVRLRDRPHRPAEAFLKILVEQTAR